MYIWSSTRIYCFACLLAGFSFDSALAENLYRPGLTQSLSSDRHAQRVGDLVTVIIVESTQSSTSQQNGTHRSTTLGGNVGAGSFNQSANLSFGNSFDGSGQVQRSESFLTQMTASIAEVLPNGDFVIVGSEKLHLNGETTTVEVRGRIRAADIDGSDQVSSNRIADAQINYNGKGFVSRSATPGIVHRLFSILGL